MRFALVLLAGCWSGSPPPPSTPVAAKTTRCEIRDRSITTGIVALSLRGSQFAQLGAPFYKLDVTFTGAVARAQVETEAFVLEGELDVRELPLRPRASDPYEDWLDIRAATGHATGDMLRLEAKLPSGLDPSTFSLELPCNALTFAAPPDPPESDVDPELVELPTGTQLRATPTGAAILRVVGYTAEDSTPGIVEGTVLERRGAMTRVQLVGDNTISVWAATAAIRPSPGNMLGGFGFGRSGFHRPESRCDRDVPIYLRLDGNALRVGRIKRKAEFFTDGDTTLEDVAIDLGPIPEGPRPFIKQADFATCN